MVSVPVLVLGVVLGACGGEQKVQPGGEISHPGSQANAETLDDGRDALERRLAPGVLSRIRDREAWRERVLAEPVLTAERRAEAHGEVGMLYHAYDLFTQAEVAYGAAIEVAPQDFRWHYLRGLARRRTNQLEAAEADFRRSTELAEGDVPSRVRLGELARDRGDEEQAAAALSMALELDPECAAALFAFGQQARTAGDLEQAAKLLERVLELQPEAAAVRTPLGLTYRDLGRENDAQRQLEQAAERGVRLRDPLLQGVYDRGEGWIQTMRTASEAANAGDFETASEALQRAIALDPLSARSRLAWARILSRRGEHEPAREQAELALFLSAHPLEPRRTLAAIALSGGDWAMAEQELRKVITLPQATPADRENLAGALEAGGKAAESLAIYRELRQMAPDDPMLVVSEATQLVNLGRCPEARENVGAALAARPNDGIIAHAQARLLSTCEPRFPQQALAVANSLFDAMPSAGHAEAVALAHASAGRFEEALEWQRRARRLAGAATPAAGHYRQVQERLAQSKLPAYPWAAGLRSWIFAGPVDE